MKEATGEANMTIITVVLIGIVSLVGFPLIKSLLDSTSNAGKCQAAGYSWSNGKCVDDSGATVTNYKD